MENNPPDDVIDDGGCCVSFSGGFDHMTMICVADEFIYKSDSYHKFGNNPLMRLIFIPQVAACVHIMRFEATGKWAADGRSHVMRLLGLKHDAMDG